MATWVEQYAQKLRGRPSASAVLTRLKGCVNDWGKSILPLIPEDWENTSSCCMSPNDWQFVHVFVTGDNDDLTIVASDLYHWIGYLAVGEGSK